MIKCMQGTRSERRRIHMFVAEHEVEIRYAETDQMGVVYHSNYLVWLELGRTKLIQDLGFSYVEMEKELFLLF
ncbi:N-terminal part of 4-hydroxybenzoyl-CoA thioesterase [Bacillus cereus biovar anthracis str. CI]|nr:N-terminal part of 4-hydroxybenzoyl-CoA thioesterase [Bacillus cereus biovar anthracis str. CI]